jgi:hypothetical protein
VELPGDPTLPPVVGCKVRARALQADAKSASRGQVGMALLLRADIETYEAPRGSSRQGQSADDLKAHFAQAHDLLLDKFPNLPQSVTGDTC